MQPSGGSFIAYDLWDSAAADSTWTARYQVYDSSGVSFTPVAGAAWQGLLQSHWYRETTVFDVNALSILSVSITDLSSGSTTTATPAGWYLMPGAPPPGAFRLFGSGSTNGLGIDNLQVDAIPEPSTLPLAALGLAAIAMRRRR